MYPEEEDQWPEYLNGTYLSSCDHCYEGKDIDVIVDTYLV